MLALLVGRRSLERGPALAEAVFCQRHIRHGETLVRNQHLALRDRSARLLGNLGIIHLLAARFYRCVLRDGVL